MGQDAARGAETYHVLKVPEVVMRTLRLRNLIIRLRLSSMNHIGELMATSQYLSFRVSTFTHLHSVLNEEHRDIVSNNVPVALIRVKLDRKATNITNSVCGSTATKNSREAEEDRRLPGCVGEHASGGHVGSGFEERKLSKGA